MYSTRICAQAWCRYWRPELFHNTQMNPRDTYLKYSDFYDLLILRISSNFRANLKMPSHKIRSAWQWYGLIGLD
jgi:hypothetical protein